MSIRARIDGAASAPVALRADVRWCNCMMAVLMIAAVALLTGCQTPFPVAMPGLTVPGGQPSDDVQIARILNEVQRGMEGRRIYQVLAHVSDTYHDSEGRTYQGMQAYLADVFKRYRTIRITRVPPRIVLDGPMAQAVETFGTLAEPVNSNDDPPMNLQGQVTVYLEKINGVWKITEWSNS